MTPALWALLLFLFLVALITLLMPARWRRYWFRDADDVCGVKDCELPIRAPRDRPEHEMKALIGMPLEEKRDEVSGHDR